MKAKPVLIVVILLNLVMCTFISVNAKADKYLDVEIDEGDYWKTELFTFSKDTVEVDIICKNDDFIDVYIMKSEQYEKKYMENDTFTPTIAKEKIKSTHFVWEAPDDDSYLLIVDNKNNTRPNDAEPKMNVVVDIEYKESWMEDFDEIMCDIDDTDDDMYFIVFMIFNTLQIILIVLVIIAILQMKKIQQQPYPPQYPPQFSPYAQTQKKPPLTQMCPICGQSIRYDEQHKKWYCDNCKKHVKYL